MYEYEIINKTTKDELWICGYSFKNACERKGLEPNDWTITYSEYID